ncbi:RsiW-degrading membrane proteinase PrsW (M82 family) [Clostridium saccharoperbutylacetonicum]|uniref:RsiW anti-sigma factor protease PrsW n=1 Tax=Clostridium saccharoperbutylacetonicum N1-4(HMT) TaxID=931276 RepID=M1MW74_9CLOT|nr:PrsW family glutamic-type intramembrane protease [Clostridium saccharoperbutylacetonicum]AGF58856.1 RsiW anti- sigma factor protease PrsW [Clostridium saccharoperbutylacetonicum N1-4(HMT)]NRT60359.1 RsiW-degrading membrane proteinase PrsW (M82 family) [Clostridium saccharoperbutylacetonicum]NSB23671.1 RsiW-degrading membrane proteinase PrsW (M82 family) [Clostridium saccharoperbutylacetonicum]NSB43043.1 RsiW-degrading membrane proteinase PrsW (M82 family) [Clostridium saccharoperbutylacetoni
MNGNCNQDENTSESFLNNPKTVTPRGIAIKLKLTDLIVNVFKKHTLEERENTFICGTALTSPKENEICSKWPKPWLYSRVFILFAITFIGLVALLRVFRNVLAYPGIVFIGALIVPFSLLVFFWEVNAPRNINIFDVVKIFFLGGISSLLITMILNSAITVGEVDFYGAILIGVTEELAKLIVVAYFARGSKRKYILNGLLLGAAVGAGFAVFETAGYVFAYGFEVHTMMKIIYTRGALAFGGHIAWAAMSGAALVMVKEDDRLKVKHFLNIKFLKYFIIAIILHSIWDMPIYIESSIPYIQVMLTLVAWIIILILINAGLKQISSLSFNGKAKAESNC